MSIVEFYIYDYVWAIGLMIHGRPKAMHRREEQYVVNVMDKMDEIRWNGIITVRVFGLSEAIPPPTPYQIWDGKRIWIALNFDFKVNAVKR